MAAKIKQAFEILMNNAIESLYVFHDDFGTSEEKSFNQAFQNTH